MSSTQTILCIISGFLIGWYIFYYVIGDIVRKIKLKKQEDDYEIKLRIVNTLPTPDESTVETLYIALNDGEKTKVWITIYNAEKNVFSWIAISDVDFDKDVSDVLF